MDAKVGTCICCHDDDSFLKEVVVSFQLAGPVVVFVSRLAWDGSAGNWHRCHDAGISAGAEVVVGDWPNESLHRREALRLMRERGFTHAFIPDSDEIIEPGLLSTLVGIAESRIAERACVHMDTYWKSPEYVIRPREALTPVILLDLEQTRHVRIREFSGGRSLTLNPDYGVLHHLSYAGGDERIQRKISTWGHRDEVIDGWYSKVWLGWDSDPLMRDLHPTHPFVYRQVEHINIPAALAGIAYPKSQEIEPLILWPKLSVVIPLYGGEADIELCLRSLEGLRDLIHEVVVVDDVSPDGAVCIAEGYDWAKVIRNERNLGFAGTCNVGFAHTTGEVVLFLNSDTVVPRAGLIRLIESLMASHSVAAAGPYSNNTGHHQQIAATYQSLETMPLFAEDMARRDVDDEDVDMLVGFCLAVKRRVLEEVGLFDTRFGTGMFEDNDLCYRIRRARLRLVLAKRAFVHHTGSQSLNRRREHPAVLLGRNQQIFLDKWKDDLRCGFASHLSGMSPERIVFNEGNRPEEIDRRLQRLAKKADITLCMIVKDGELTLGPCLESTTYGFVKRVVVDTGSADRTMEVAARHDIDLCQMDWPDSFAAARNHSMSFAKSKWIMWLDADDTIDRRSLERILEAVIGAPKQIGGFVVPVSFGDGPSGGTQVDHLKVFRNLPSIKFEGRIHEQILSSIRASGFTITPIDHAVVLHSGYDRSPGGQAIKRERDEKHLWLDYQDDPNHPFRRFNIGMTAHRNGEHEKAIEWLTSCLGICGPDDSILNCAYTMLGASRREIGDPEAGLATMMEGLERVPGDPELLFEAGKTLHQLGRLAEAKQMYLQIPAQPTGRLGSYDVGILTFKKFHNLGSVCIAMGQYREAIAWWKAAVQCAPSFSPSAEAMFEEAIQHGDLRTAREALDAVRVALGPTEPWAQLLCRWSTEAGQDPEAAIRGALQTFPYSVGLLSVLSRMFVGRGDERGAAPLLQELERLGSAEGAFFLGLIAIRRADFFAGLEHMLIAQSLNPDHEPTQQQVAELRRILVEQMPPKLDGSGEDVLVGPHVGKLGAAKSGTSVVVVTYNSVCTIAECARRVLGSIGPQDELIIVDNASQDGTQRVLEGIAAGDTRIKLILNEQNVGYSPAANQGMLASKGKNIVTLNPDAYVNPGWIEAMSTHLKKGVAAVGPTSDNIGGDQFVGSVLGKRHPKLEEIPKILAEERAGAAIDTKFLVGICVMVRRETLNRHGLLDEGTELGADDLEFSWRNRMLGQRPVVAQDVFVQHEQGVSFASLPSAERIMRQLRSDAALWRKLEAFYGRGNIPSSVEQWGTPIFEEAQERMKLLGDALS